MMHFFPWMILLAATLMACQPSVDPQHLSGSWKVDSVYRYYNGFDMRLPGKVDDPTYHYVAGNKVREQMGREYQEYIWEWKGADTLVYRAPDGGEIGTYQVLQLKPATLALKRKQPEVFAGEGQERYEIRYFSRIPTQP